VAGACNSNGRIESMNSSPGLGEVRVHGNLEIDLGFGGSEQKFAMSDGVTQN
jgi:hypothetical protein